MEENELLSAAVCPQCSAPLKPVDENGVMKCEFCGAVLLDKRHSFVHTTRDFESEMNHYIENAECLMEDGEYSTAFNQFRQVAENFSRDYRGWWGMARAATEEFSDTDISEDDFKRLYKHYTNALSKAPDDKKQEIEAVFAEYNAAVKKVNQSLAKLYERIERNERLIALSYPISIAVYTVFMFVYSIIYILINNPQLGNAGGGVIGAVLPALIFGIAYGVWAMVQDSEYAIIGVPIAAVLSGIMWNAAWFILFQKTEFTQLIVMTIVYAAAFIPGFFMTKKARGY